MLEDNRLKARRFSGSDIAFQNSIDMVILAVPDLRHYPLHPGRGGSTSRAQ